MKTYIKPAIEFVELLEEESVMLLSVSGTKADNSEVFANPFRGIGGNPFANPFSGNPTSNPFGD